MVSLKNNYALAYLFEVVPSLLTLMMRLGFEGKDKTGARANGAFDSQRPAHLLNDRFDRSKACASSHKNNGLLRVFS